MNPKTIMENKRLLKMVQMQRNAEACGLGLNIGDCDEAFEQKFIEGREFDMFLFGFIQMGVGHDGQWLVDVSKIPHQMNFKEAPEGEDDYIHPFLTVLNYCVIEELIHAVIGISHNDCSRENFLAFIARMMDCKYNTGAVPNDSGLED